MLLTVNHPILSAEYTPLFCVCARAETATPPIQMKGNGFAKQLNQEMDVFTMAMDEQDS